MPAQVRVLTWLWMLLIMCFTLSARILRSEKEVDDMMNSLLVRFPDYPPMKALVNDSTIGNYMSAQSFDIWGELQLRMYSDRFKKDDTIKVKPLKVGDYIL